MWDLSAWEVLAWVALVVVVLVLDPVKGVWGFAGRLSDAATGTVNVRSVGDRLVYLVAFTHQFVTRPLWPLTILYVVGLVELIVRRVRKAPIDGDGVALALYGLGFCAWLVTSVLSKLHDDRYLFGVIPFYLSPRFAAVT